MENKNNILPKKIVYHSNKKWVKVDELEITLSEWMDICRNNDKDEFIGFIFSWVKDWIEKKDDTLNTEGIFYHNARKDLGDYLFNKDTFITLQPSKWRLEIRYKNRFVISKPAVAGIILQSLTGDDSKFTIKS